MHTETAGVERNGRQNEPGSVAVARCDYLLLGVCDWTTRYNRYDTYTYTVGTSYQFPGRRTEGARFVIMYVLGVRCVVYVKGLGETYTTLDRRVLLLLLYLLLLIDKKNKKVDE